MACTQQSAVEYIKNARVILVEQLKNQPLIVEKLREKEVLNLHQCTEINEEPKTFEKNRKIMDFVTRKGNKACYELLRVLNTTRQRTLPKPTGQQKDLHHWISCFPFTEDQEMEPSLGSKACQEYQKQLRTEAQKILQASVRQKKCLGGDAAPEAFCYTPLVLDPDTDHNSVTSKIQTKSKKYKKSRPKKLKSFIPKAQGQLSPEDLLWGEKNLIVLVGKPGIGKSTVTHQMLHLWCERQNGGLDYLFYLDDRLFSTSAPARLESLFDSYVEPRESREEVYEDITEHSENVTIIFDGLTDVLLHPLLEKIITKSILEDARIVITCRPEQLFDLSERIDPHVVHVQGFSEESIRTYLTEKLSDQPDAVASVVEHLELFSLCHVPLHAFMVAACISFLSRKADRSWNVTEIHLHIFRQIIMKCENVSMRNIDGWIRKHGEQILSLAEIARNATLQKTLDIRDHEASGIQCHFLKSLSVMDTPTSVRNHSAFLNSSMQDFFGALWLLCHPAEIDAFLQKCWTEEGKHLKYTIPFLCGFMSERNIPLLKGLVPKTQIQLASDCFHEKLLRLLFEPEGDQHFEKSEEEELSNIADDEDLLFHCQCLYESQSPEACLQFLERLKWHLDLSGSHLDPHQCCTLAYVISQSKEQKVHLELKKCRISDPGVKMILGCSQHFSSASTLCHVWLHVLSSEDPRDFTGLLAACGNELHLPVGEQPTIFKNAGGILRRSPGKINLCMHWDTTTHHLSKALWTVIFSEFPHIHSIRLNLPLEDQNLRLKSLHQDLCVLGAEFFFRILYGLHSSHKAPAEMGLFLMDLYSSLMKSFLPALQPVYQPASALWTIDLSERTTSIFIQMLKFQTEKKPVELRGSRSFLQCLKYMSHLGFTLQYFTCSVEQEKRVKMFLLNLCLQAALCQTETIKTTVETLMVLFHKYCRDRSSFLLDLCSHVKNYESQTGGSFLPALQPVYQSASPAVWTIDLSERKASIFLEVLKMQPEKKPVELRGWSDEESEVRSFLQCLNYVSQLRFHVDYDDERRKKAVQFLLNLITAAAEWDAATGESFSKILTSVCSYKTFPSRNCFNDGYLWKFQSDFLLDLCSHVKNYESQTGRSFLPALQPVYQSASPAVWTIDLSERKASIFLEVLKMQPEKRPVELRGWSDEESEVRSFLQCLNYVSQLRFHVDYDDERWKNAMQVLLNLINAATEWDAATGESFSKILTSVCSYKTFPLGDDNKPKFQSYFLLDLYSHVKNYESQTGRSFLPALQPVYQSAAPAVWTIDLSERKASIFLEVLKMQPEKKPVELRGWSDEESEVRSFLQCLNYVSQLSFCVDDYDEKIRKKHMQILLNLCTAAAEWDAATGESFSKILTSVCSYKTFPFEYDNLIYDVDEGDIIYQSDFLLDLYSHVKNYESQTGRSFLPALQPVYQSAAPAVWTIDLSARKTSIFLEVLKMQRGKKPVKLRGWSDEESEVRSFLQCLNYVSQLRFYVDYDDERRKEDVQVLLNLFTSAAEWDAATGESFSNISTSVCSYKTFPFGDVHFDDDYDDDVIYQSDFLLDLCSHVKNYESQTGRSFLPALQPVYQSAAPAVWTIDLSERKASIFLEVLKMQTEKKPVELRGWSDEESEVRSFLRCLNYISQLRFTLQNKNISVEQKKRVKMFLLDLCQQAALCQTETIKTTVETLMVLFHKYCTDRSSFLLDLCSHMKNYECQTGRSLLPALQPVYQSASPAVWTIDLSERKASIFLEVLKMQTEKRPVELRGWSDEESEVRSFLQCLNYVSQLRFHVDYDDGRWKKDVQVLLNLYSAATECDAATGESFSKILTSVCSYKTFPLGDDYHLWIQSDFLLDLCSHVKNYESQTGRSFLPALQPVYQLAAPAVWTIDLSERKASIFLEVLKMQPEKKPVELRGWSDEESEVRSFLQCLNYVSQLRFRVGYDDERRKKAVQFLLNLITAAAEWDAATGESFSKILTSVCSYKTFPRGDGFNDGYLRKFQSDFLLDLCSHVKNYESQTGRSFLTALQPVYQSASPAVWTIDLSERKASIFLEVLKMQPEKKPVELRGWSDEESEVRSFLRCLNYVSQLRFVPDLFWRHKSGPQVLLNLFTAAAEWDAAAGESFSKILTSVCSYKTFPLGDYNKPKFRSYFLLDLYSHVKNYESQTGRSFLPALQAVYQSASPAVWTIDLSERKASIFLEVLKMQTEKRPVELRGWSDEESEVRSFLQCLNYVSQLRFRVGYYDERRKKAVQVLLNLYTAAAEWDAATGESFSKNLTSVCSYKTFPSGNCFDDENLRKFKSKFLLDLCSHVKNYESQTGRSFLPALQPVYQSAPPAVWTIDLSERKASIFLEVLKMQPEKKPVELRGWSGEEGEVRSFLPCLNYVSQLRFHPDLYWRHKSGPQFLLNLFTAAAEWDAATGESFSKILTSMCSYKTFPLGDDNKPKFRSYFLLDLCSHVMNYESQTGRSFLPALQPVYQSASPAVWTIDLSERKASIFLEVLKMQTEKRPVELRGWSDEESEVRSFLQCLNYVSQLRFDPDIFWRHESGPQFLLSLITAAAEWDADTGEGFSKILTSVCSYKTFPSGNCFDDENLRQFKSNFLQDLCSHVKNYESQTGRSFLPALQPVYQSASPAVWTIDLSERKASIFLEVLKMQTEKRPVVLRGWSDEDSEVRSFLPCLNYVSQLRFYPDFLWAHKSVPKFLLNLITAAAEWDAATGESFSNILTSVCSYKTFPLGDDYHIWIQSDFLLDLCSHVKNYESQTGRSFLPALQAVYQSASPAVWTIDLSERKASIFLEVLKMQPEKKPVELRGWSDEESEVRSFLQCLNYVSQLSGADEFFPAVCKAVGPRQVEQVTPLLQAMGFTLTLGGDLSSHCCRSVGRVLGLSASRLDLTLQPEHISLRGTRLIFKHIHTLHKLRLNKKMLFRITRALRSQGGCSSVTIEELSLIQPEGALSRILSSLVLLLRHWTVRCLDLTACQIEAQSVTGLLMYQGLLTIRLSAESLQQLTLLVYEAQEEELTQHFLQKVGGDLTSCSLNWEVIHYLLQVKGPPITVDFRRNKMTLQNIRDIFPHGNRVMIKRLPPRFLMVIMREIYVTRAAHCVSSLLKWSEKNIVLNSRVLDAADCAALCFTLQHSEGVQLSLLWSSIPEGALENILLLLNNVSLLSVDRKLLLQLLRCCSSSELQQGAAAALLRSLQHRLNFSCVSAVDLTGPSDGQVLVLGHEDCRVFSMVIQRSSVAVELSLHDCEIEDAGLQQFFPILHQIRLSCSKALLLHFLSLLSGGSEAESVKWAESLSQALGREVDLSHTPVDHGACQSIVLLLEYSEGLSELDLSHCQLTDRCLELLLPHLQKTRVLDLSNNNITDCMTERLYSIMSASSNLHTVRLFNNKITDKKLLVTDRRVEIW
ncbi:uncharacterized protein LOC114796724 [Denticeps clupeoides]|uniref:uncharacterized protein LOC114796724 n=1 Tax=Denticeps clupeoides TaxID=299321 RepID=UPI0010A4CEE8|nr:uncharacterized protein LOC114796724 [Denticeps clupeoides]